MRRFAALVAHGDPAHRAVLAALRRLQPAADRDVLAEGLRLLVQPLPLAGFRPPMPVHLLQGAADALVPMSAAQALAEALPGTDLEMIESGHAPHLSDPEAVAARLEADT